MTKLPRFETKQRKLVIIDEAIERWWRRVKRGINEIDKLQTRRKRLTAVRKLDAHERSDDGIARNGVAEFDDSLD